MLKRAESDVAYKRILAHFLIALACITVSIIFFGVGTAGALELKNHKNRLFAYPETLKSSDGGDYRIIDYQELRDINGRDDVPEKRVQRKYIDYAAKRAGRKGSVSTNTGRINYYYVGNAKTASVITIYVHGRGGNGKQGMSDVTFGGNFNRLKMLMLKNNGLYLSPDAENLDASSVERIAAMVEKHVGPNSNIPIVLACGSAGGSVCHTMANHPRMAARLKGVIFVGSYWSDDYISSVSIRSGTKTYIGHGSRDPIFDIEKMERFYLTLRRAGAPVRMRRFETGSHGTPIRMIDWREAINWILN